MNREKIDQQLHNNDAIAERYFKKHNIPSSSYIRKNRIMKAIKPVSEKNKSLGDVVDIGCGIGSTAKYLEGKYESYLGIDYSDALIKTAKKFNHDNNKARFICNNVKSREVPDNCADIILALGVLHHMTELDTVMKSIGRIGKPGANIVAIEPIDVNLFVQFMRWIRGKIDSGYSEEQHFFSYEELKDLFKKNGFSEITFRYHGVISKPLSELIIINRFIPQSIAALFVKFDEIIENKFPWLLKRVAWDIIITAKCPNENT